MTTTADTADPFFAEWAIVEMLGHRRLAGYLREVQIAGQGFFRLDIPAAGNDPGRTQYLAPGSIYALHPVSEATACRVAQAWRPEPVQRWELSLPAIEPPNLPKPQPVHDEDDIDANPDPWEPGHGDPL